MIFRGRLGAHRNRVRVLEPQRWKPAKTIEVFETLGHVVEYSGGISCEAVVERIVKHGHESRAGVLGKDVERALSERTECNLGCAKARTADHRNSSRFENLREHFSKQIRLAERFGSDHQRLFRFC